MRRRARAPWLAALVAFLLAQVAVAPEEAPLPPGRAVPARLGQGVGGGEGAVALGGLAAAVVGPLIGFAPGSLSVLMMALAGMCAGGLWSGLVGATRHYRGINETCPSLLMA